MTTTARAPCFSEADQEVVVDVSGEPFSNRGRRRRARSRDCATSSGVKPPHDEYPPRRRVAMRSAAQVGPSRERDLRVRTAATERHSRGIAGPSLRSRPAARAAGHTASGVVDRGFRVGSACFVAGPSRVSCMVGCWGDAAVFFAGSLFVTTAAALAVPRGRQCRREPNASRAPAGAGARVRVAGSNGGRAHQARRHAVPTEHVSALEGPLEREDDRRSGGPDASVPASCSRARSPGARYGAAAREGISQGGRAGHLAARAFGGRPARGSVVPRPATFTTSPPQTHHLRRALFFMAAPY